MCKNNTNQNLIIHRIALVVKGMDDEITSYEKSIHDIENRVEFLKGTVSGLKRAKTTLDIFFKNELEENKNG